MRQSARFNSQGATPSPSTTWSHISCGPVMSGNANARSSH